MMEWSLDGQGMPLYGFFARSTVGFEPEWPPVRGFARLGFAYWHLTESEP